MAIPCELEGDEIVTWDVFNLDNSKNDIAMDIYEIKNALDSVASNIATHEVKGLFKDLQSFFEEQVEALEIVDNKE